MSLYKYIYMLSKSHIRKLILAKRKTYNETDVIDKSKSISEKLFKQFYFNDFKIIHTFIPLKNEVNTWEIIEKINEKYQNIKIIIPKCNNTHELLHFEYKGAVLKPNKYGILEPYKSKQFTTFDKIDLILVPLLAFDITGDRVGYGGGYYDKFLVKCKKAKKIGVSLEEPINKIIDTNSFDIKLDYCITPKSIYKFSK
jgi:5-formyltetrahydrofolate cyclo-ligase